MNMTKFNVILLGFLTIFVVGCNQITTPNTPESPAHPPDGTAEITETQTIPVAPTQWGDMPKDPPLPIPRSPGLKTLIERAKADLAQRLSIPTSQIKVIETKEASWPDGSLGCPQPDVVYSKFPTPGYLVRLEYGVNEFEYHLSIHGDTLYCENPQPPSLGTPADIYPLTVSPP